MAWRGVAWCGVVWRGVAWCGVWCGVVCAVMPFHLWVLSLTPDPLPITVMLQAVFLFFLVEIYCIITTARQAVLWLISLFPFVFGYFITVLFQGSKALLPWLFSMP